MTQEPQHPPVEPLGHNGQPSEPPKVQPQWGQSAPQVAPQPQWGQSAPPSGQPYPGQPYPEATSYPGGPGPGFTQYTAPPKPGVIPLRPLGLGEILDGAFQAARRNGKAMFGSALIFQLAITAITLLIMFLTLGQFLGEIFAFDSGFNDSDPASLEALGGGLVAYSVSLLLTAFLSVVIQMVLQGALVVPVLRAVLNRKTTFGDMWRLTKPRVGALVVLALLYAAAFVVALIIYTLIVVGLIFAMSPDTDAGILGVIGLSVLLSLPFLALGIWVSTKVLLAPAAIVVENIGTLAGIKRSWQLTRRNWWRTFGTYLLAAIIAGVIGSVITTPVAMIAGFLMPVLAGTEATPEQLATQLLVVQAISGVVGALVGAVTLAFQTGVMALIYVDLRMRRDGFDITLLKEAETGMDDGQIPGSPAYAGAASSSFAMGPQNNPPHSPHSNYGP